MNRGELRRSMAALEPGGYSHSYRVLCERPFRLDGCMDPDNSLINIGSLHQRGSSGCSSPAYSYESMTSDRSIGLPCNFKGDDAHPDDSCVQRGSPAPSCASVRSDWSKDSPPNFKEGGPHPDSSWMKEENSDCPSPSCLSMKSDKSMDRPMNFLTSPESSEVSSSVLTADHVRCSLCSSTLKDPVSIPCGHSYCQTCIDNQWSKPSPAGDYVCLQCERSYPIRPELSINEAFTWLLQAVQKTGWTACDICTVESGPRPAIKTCMTCGPSYCEDHVRHHYTVPALMGHTLVQANQGPLPYPKIVV